MAVMYRAMYPTCLMNYFDSISLIGLKFSFFGGDAFANAINNTNI